MGRFPGRSIGRDTIALPVKSVVHLNACVNTFVIFDFRQRCCWRFESSRMLSLPTFRRIVTSSSSRSSSARRVTVWPLKWFAILRNVDSYLAVDTAQHPLKALNIFKQTSCHTEGFFLFLLRWHWFFCQNYPWKARLRIAASSDRNPLQRVRAMCDELLVTF